MPVAFLKCEVIILRVKLHILLAAVQDDRPMIVILRFTCAAQTLQIILNLDHYSDIKTSLYLWAIKHGTKQKLRRAVVVCEHPGFQI